MAFDADTDGDGRIEAEEAFAYADAVKDPRDTPNFSESSEEGGDITLGQEFVIWWWWWWCDIFHRLFYPIYIKLPPEEYQEKAIQYLTANARTFEEVRMAAAGLEALQAHSPQSTLNRLFLETFRRQL